MRSERSEFFFEFYHFQFKQQQYKYYFDDIYFELDRDLEIKSEALKIINYDHLVKNNDLDNIYLIKQIEIEIHKKLQEKYYNKNVIFQISHNDQYDKPYHIHRLIHDKN